MPPNKPVEPPSIAASVLQPLLVTLRQRGLDVEPLLQSHEIDEARLAEIGYRLPEQQLIRIWQQSLQLADDPALAIHVARITSPQAFGILGYVLSNAVNLGQVIRLIVRFNRLVFDEALIIPRSHANGEAELALRRDPEADPEQNRPMVEYLLVVLLRLASLLAAGEDMAARYLRRVELRHARPGAAVERAYAQVFGAVDIRYAAPQNLIAFAPEAMTLPIAFGDPKLLQIMMEQANQRLRELATETDVVQRAGASIRRRLLGRAPSIQVVAGDCGMSRAGLQRRLAQADTSFQLLLDQCRLDTARTLLGTPGQSISEVAQLLGYADPASFHHAFKRWTGQTPGAWRRSITE